MIGQDGSELGMDEDSGDNASEGMEGARSSTWRLGASSTDAVDGSGSQAPPPFAGTPFEGAAYARGYDEIEGDVHYAIMPFLNDKVDSFAGPFAYQRQDEREQEGGQARVLRVKSLHTDRDLALKLFGRSARAAEQAEREWCILQDHRNDETVPLAYLLGMVDADNTGSRRTGEYAIVMEWIEGRTLQALLNDGAYRRTLTVERALRTIAPVVRFCANSCRSRDHAVHRDIKPANIIVQDPDSAAGVRLIDFGIAAGARASSRRDPGTAGYSAPELDPARFPSARGEADDHRVDTYSLAAVLYAMLQGGAPPFPDGRGADAGERAAGHGLSGDFPFDWRLRHEEGVEVAERAKRYLKEMFAVEVDDERLEAALGKAFLERDYHLARVLDRCLSFDQEQRPMPDELESLLLLDASHYREALFGIVVTGCLQTGGPVSTCSEPPLVSDGTFAEALAKFNSGRYGEAVPVLRLLADQGDASAMYYLGCCIRDGLGAEYDPAAVFYLFSRAAKAGNTPAQNAHGLRLFRGDGVKKDEREGLKWICRSALDVEEDGVLVKVGFPPAKKWLEENGYGSASAWLDDYGHEEPAGA